MEVWSEVKLLILFFSGTGNTAFVVRSVARQVAEALSDLRVEIELRSIEWQAAENVGDFDVLALGFPVYACDAPGLVRGYVDRLPPGDGRAAFVFCTKGLVAGGTVERNLARLAARGYEPLGGGSVLMPGTDGLAMAGKGSAMARRAVEKDYDRLPDVDRLAAALSLAVRKQVRGMPGEAGGSTQAPSPKVARADRVWSWLYRVTERYALSRLHADEECVECGLCARLCPVQVIELRDGRPRFGKGCALCLRCLHACPQEAIQIGRLTQGRFRWKGPEAGFRPLGMRPGGDEGQTVF